MVVTTVSSKSDENRVIPELLISPNAHNQRKYWIAIKANLFRDRAYSPSFSPPKATSIQWGSFYNANGLSVFTYPLGLSSKPYEIITTEGDPAGWNQGNGIVVSGADITTASNTQANILSKWVNNGGTVKQGGAAVRVLIIGH